MGINESNTSVNIYIISLVVAVLALLITTAISYRHVQNLEKSAELVNHSVMVDKELNRMFSNYSLLKSSKFDYVISKNNTSYSHFNSYKEQSEDALENLKKLTKDHPNQQKKLEEISKLKLEFIEHLDSMITWKEHN